MMKGRGLWLAPALLGAFWMSRSRGSHSGWDMLNQLRRGRSYHRRSSHGWLGHGLLSSLLGRKTGLRLFR